MITFSLDAVQFTSVFGNIRELVRKSLVDPELGTVSKQAQLLTEHCIKLTPPKNAAQGKKRVAADVEKIFHPLDPGDFKSADIARLIRKSDAQAWNEMTRHISSGPLAGTHAVTPSPSLHRLNRDRRGRAKRTNYVTLLSDRAALKQLREAAIARVGWAKAGWLRAYIGLRGLRAPGFATRHGAVRGVFNDGRAAANPFIEAANDTSWGKGGESKRIVSAAFTARTRAMRSYFNATMKLASEAKPTMWQAKMRAVDSQSDITA